LAGLKRDLTEDDFDDLPMTTWHHDFDEGFWFAATTAYHEEDPIQHVIVANLTEKSYEFRIRDLVARISSGLASFRLTGCIQLGSGAFVSLISNGTR
jgi:hypothetical protein